MSTFPSIASDEARAVSADLATPTTRPGGSVERTVGGTIAGTRPVPSFWNFDENETGGDRFAGHGRPSFEEMRHHA